MQILIPLHVSTRERCFNENGLWFNTSQLCVGFKSDWCKSVSGIRHNDILQSEIVLNPCKSFCSPYTVLVRCLNSTCSLTPYRLINDMQQRLFLYMHDVDVYRLLEVFIIPNCELKFPGSWSFKLAKSVPFCSFFEVFQFIERKVVGSRSVKEAVESLGRKVAKALVKSF